MLYTILEGRLCPSRLDISSLIYQSVELDIVQRHVQWWLSFIDDKRVGYGLGCLLRLVAGNLSWSNASTQRIIDTEKPSMNLGL